jgi:hypothetical protein
MLGLLSFGGPFVLGAILGGWFGTTWSRLYALCALGLLICFGFLAYAYLTAPPDYQHANGTEGREYLGRWWDPEYDLTLAALSYLTWLIAVCLAAIVRFFITPTRTAKPS